MTMFGAFLMSRGVVTATEVVRALDEQERRRVPVASLALSLGILDAHQTLKVLDAQRETRRCFSDCAVELGFASKAEMDRARQESERSAPRLGELLVQLGILTETTLKREVALFKLESDPRTPPSSPSLSRRAREPRLDDVVTELLRSKEPPER